MVDSFSVKFSWIKVQYDNGIYRRYALMALNPPSLPMMRVTY